MRVTLHRKGKVKAFETVLTMEALSSDRQDIVELLQYIAENGGAAKEEILSHAIGNEVPLNIVTGIIDHLKGIDLLNSNGTLSAKGKKVIEMGLVPVEERGQFFTYHIEDELLKHHLLHYERSSEKGRRQRVETKESLDGNIYKNISFQSVINKKQFKIKQFDGNSHLGSIIEESGTYHFYWDIDLSREEPSKFQLSGELKNFNNQSFRFNRQDVLGKEYKHTKELMYSLVDKIKPNDTIWNSSNGYLEVPLNIFPLENYEKLITSLKVPVLNMGNMGEFEATEISSIPIGPRNAHDAKKWLTLLAKKYLEEGYKNEQELLTYLKDFKEHIAFRNYYYAINEMSITDVLEELKTANYNTAYWNLQAPLDLFANVDTRYVIHNRRVDISSGTPMSMMELVGEITGDEEPEVLVFSSKYINNPAQIRKFETFVKAFQAKGVRDVVLVTKEARSFKTAEIQVELYDDIYAGSTHPHDRYLAYKSRGIWHRFKMTAELDQCRYENWRESNEYTRGKWEDISFYEIRPEIFPEKLNERLNLVEEVYYL